MSFSSNRTKPNNINLNDAQTLDNKTLTGNTIIQDGATIIKPDIIDPDRLDVKKATLSALETYATTATEGQLCYATDVKKMYQIKNNALAEVGSGSAGVNYIENSDFEVNLDGWNEAASNITLALESVAPLRGTKSLKLTKLSGASRLGQFIATDAFTVDTADLAKKLTGSFDYDFSDVDYADGHARIEIEADPAGTPQTIRVNGEDIKAGKGRHFFQFQTDATITDYRLKIVWQDATDSEVIAYIDDVQVGPTNLVYGTIVTDWESYTPTISWSGNVSTVEGKYRRVGDTLEAEVYFTTTGVPTGSGLNTTIPFGLSIDTDKIASYQQQQSLGRGTYTDITDVSFAGDIWISNQTTVFAKYTFNSDGAPRGTYQANVSTTAPFSPASGDKFYLKYSVPIAGWSSNAQISEDLGGREIVVRGAGNAGAAITATTEAIDFTEVEDTTSSWSQVGSHGPDTFTAPETGYYSITGSVAATSASTFSVRAYIDGTNDVYLGLAHASSQFRSFSGIVKLTKGQDLTIRTEDNITLSNNTSTHWIHIQKLASPQTILETETVAFTAEDNSGQAITTTFGNITFNTVLNDTHNAYNTSTGEYTIPVSGYYSYSATIEKNSTSAARLELRLDTNIQAGIRRNKTQISTNIASPITCNLNTMYYFNKGTVLTLKADCDQNVNMTSDLSRNHVSIYRIK